MENNNNINLNQDIIRHLNQETVNQLNEITTSPLNQETINSMNNQPVNPLNQPVSSTNQEKISSLNQALSSLNQELIKQKDNNKNKEEEKKNKKKKKKKKKEVSLIDKFLEDIKYLKETLRNLMGTVYTLKIKNYNDFKKRSEQLDEKIKKINILDENDNSFSKKLNELKNQMEDMFNFLSKNHNSQNNLNKGHEKISEAINVNETIKQFKNPQTTTSEINLTNNNLYEQLKELRSRIDSMFDIALNTIKSQKNVNESSEKTFNAICFSNSMESWQCLQFIISAAKESMQEAKKIVEKDVAVLTKICDCFKEYVECLEEIIK